MTEKLFYADAHMRKFTARVLSCEERGGRFAVTLDRTAFFPEGGGQGGDTGALGGVRVTERIMPGVVYQDHGARVDSIVPGYGGLDRGGANNLICPSAVTSPNCAGEVTSSFLVGVEKVDVFELAKQYPEAFARTFDPATGQVASDFIVEGE